MGVFMAKYLVTGGAGFIGSNIVERLVGLGHDVRVVDNLSTGRLENIENFHNRIEFINADLSDYKTAAESVKGIDYIIHEAAMPSVPLSVQDPVGVNRSIVNTTVNLFKAAVDSGSVKRIVQAASASAYGNSEVLPKNEDMNPEPLSPYAVAKVTQEYYGKAFFHIYGLEVISLRYFNVFGPKQDPGSYYAGVISIFTNTMLQGNAPVIFGDGLTSRDYIYIDDVVDANLSACSCRWPGRSEVINVGCGNRLSLNELVETLNKILGKNLKPVYKDERVGDVKHSQADITRARNILGFNPRVGVEEGLVKLIDWMKK
ncbi:MAG: SDR family oxidoreductase [Bacillota bacterium]|nr:SDR family oxidoreductase [Bacillota bacterium]